MTTEIEETVERMISLHGLDRARLWARDHQISYASNTTQFAYWGRIADRLNNYSTCEHGHQNCNPTGTGKCGDECY